MSPPSAPEGREINWHEAGEVLGAGLAEGPGDQVDASPPPLLLLREGVSHSTWADSLAPAARSSRAESVSVNKALWCPHRFSAPASDLVQSSGFRGRRRRETSLESFRCGVDKFPGLGQGSGGGVSSCLAPQGGTSHEVTFPCRMGFIHGERCSPALPRNTAQCVPGTPQ